MLKPLPSPSPRFRKCAAFSLFLGLLVPLLLPAAPVTQVKVLSFNIRRDGIQGLTSCIDVIRTSGADIVGLQECSAATAQTIATSLGFNVLPASDSSIVTRFPILATFKVGNSSGVTLELSPGQRAHFFNCHPVAYPYGPYDLRDGKPLDYILNQENTTRLPAVKQLLYVMQPYIGGFEPCFLTGDFNAPSHLDYANLPWPTSVACIQAGLSDSYRDLHTTNRLFTGAFAYDDPGITWTPELSEETKGVFDRIDFVYYSPGRGVTPLDSAELDQRNSVNPWPSDHRAVLTTFNVVAPVPETQASQPVPANLAVSPTPNPVLIWLPGANATNHSIYLGTNATLSLWLQTTNSFLSLTNLQPGTTYYWRVDETTPDGTVTGKVWSFTTKHEVVYEWNFNQGDLSPALGHGIFAYADGVTTSNLTTFGVSDGTTIPHLGSQPTKYLRAPAFTGTGNGYTLSFPDSLPNGGGAYLNQYTIIIDLLLPSPANWTALFNTSTANANDADFYVAANGSVGIGELGYSATGLVAPNTWYRLAFVADLAAKNVTYYLNGTSVHTGSSGLDGRFALYSSLDPGASLLLLNEGDSSGVYTHIAYLSSVCFVDRNLSAAEIAALGGPKARGIFAPVPPTRLSASLNHSTLALNWSGGQGPYKVQKTSTLTGTPIWQDVGTVTTSTNLTITPDGEATFFRVVDQAP